MAAGDLITADGQIEWGGVLLGSGTVYVWSGADDSLTGWEDMPALDQGAVRRPSRHGSWPGKNYAQERIVSWKCDVKTSSTAFGAAVTALRRATPVSDGDTDEPLVIRTKWGETLLAYGRVTSRIMPNNRLAGIGRGTAAIQWTCTDPRRYSVAEYTETIQQPSAAGGLDYPLVYPLVYATGGETGTRSVTNAGDAASSPVITITGPVTLPSINNLTNGQALELDITLAAGEEIVIDTAAGTVLLGTADRMAQLTGRSVPPELFTLPADTTSELAYRADVFGGGSTAVITWRDAYL